jgi:hypothetical protein
MHHRIDIEPQRVLLLVSNALSTVAVGLLPLRPLPNPLAMKYLAVAVLALARTTSAAVAQQDTLLMLWTAPILRHRSAIGWLRRNAPLEGSRPWARLARSVSIS